MIKIRSIFDNLTVYTICVFLGGCLIVLTILFFLAFPTMLLWNWLMPTLFNVPPINFLQAFGINVLASIFFKSTAYVNK